MIDEELKAILACPACKGDLLFEIVASREASALILGLERGVEEQETDEGTLEPVPGPG